MSLPESPTFTPDPEPQEPAPQPTRRAALPRLVWQGELLPAYWTIASTLSLVVNVVLLVIVILLGRQLFTITGLLNEQLVGGLANNFVLMDQAVIATNVVVDTRIPVQFTLPVSKKTTVVLTEDILVEGARVDLSTGGLTIRNAPTDILLPEGTPLNVKLEMEIPVDASIPVVLNVPVRIPLNETDLHTPFVGLRQVLDPYQALLGDLPDSWKELFCKERPNGLLCRLAQ
jgi:hypothetical protein